MSECEKCKALEDDWGDDKVFVLCMETQMCIWESPTSLPEVDIQEATCLSCYCCKEHAMDGVQKYLLQVGAKPLWSDVRPIETCACCEKDFDATRSHKTLVLSVEEGPFTSPTTLEVEYVARFCNKCVP
jgi:hypothetical protein